MTVASEPDILAGVERWARVRGFKLQQDPVTHGLRWGYGNASEAAVWLVAETPSPYWTVPPALALAWALLVETDAGPVDVGRCQVCQGRGHPLRQSLSLDEKGRPMWLCHACNGTGRETIPVARLLLDAASGDVRALEHLPKYADRLQADGDPRGELLAWALGPWSGEPVDFGPCDDDRCEDGMTDSGGVTQWDTAAMVPCPACKGTARMLGHPHTAAALRWLEWLTWAREDAAPFEAAKLAGVVATRGEFEALARAARRAGWVEGIGVPMRLFVPTIRGLEPIDLDPGAQPLVRWPAPR